VERLPYPNECRLWARVAGLLVGNGPAVSEGVVTYVSLFVLLLVAVGSSSLLHAPISGATIIEKPSFFKNSFLSI
jgi:hypothetical protein